MVRSPIIPAKPPKQPVAPKVVPKSQIVADAKKDQKNSTLTAKKASPLKKPPKKKKPATPTRIAIRRS